MMNTMSGINHGAPFQGSAGLLGLIPRALPWAAMARPFGAGLWSAKGAAHDSPGQRPGTKGATHDSPGQRPGTNGVIHNSPGHRPGTASASDAGAKMREPSAHGVANVSNDGAVGWSAEGAANGSPGQRPGSSIRPIQSALKGRDNPARHEMIRSFHWVALSGLTHLLLAMGPRALPWAGMARPVGAGAAAP